MILNVQVSGEKEFFAQMVVDAVSKLDPVTLDLKLIGIKKVQVILVNLAPALNAGRIPCKTPAF
jgi:hypothetical protein